MPAQHPNVGLFSSWRRILTVVLIAAVLVPILWILWIRHDAPPPRVHRHEPETPRASRAPRYVDDNRCAECHADIDAMYRRHPMGRSMGPIGELPAAGEDATATFTAGEFRYEVLRRGDEILHVETRLDEQGEPLATTSVPVAYAIGSGERGRSYIINREGRLFMSPITWYPQEERWDLSPGYEKQNSHFNRPVITQCLFCHANRTHHVEGTLASYETPIFSGHAIGCQRCHGPGEDHIALHEGTAEDEGWEETIVNPARLEPKLREAVCQQCHLSGEAKVVRRGKRLDDFRPGMPLEDIIRIFVDEEPQGETAPFVGHVEQLSASRCFQASDGSMGCISCHNPHMSPAKEVRVEFYRSKCLSCHKEQGCTEPAPVRKAAGDDNCMQCHMPPRQTEIRHAAITDHRIPRRPEAAPEPKGRTDVSGTSASLRPFHAPHGDDAELYRDRALALLRLDDSEAVTLDDTVLREAARNLQDAVRRHPDDLPAWEGLGILASRLGDPAFGLHCFESVLRQAPQQEFALSNAASLSAALGRTEQALHYWQQAGEINPWMVRYLAEFSQALARLGRWAECEASCRQTLEHFPGSHRSRQLLIESLLAQGEVEQADREFASWLRFRPGDPDRLRTWFEGHPFRKR